MKNKKIEQVIEKIFEKLELGTIKSITYTKSSQNIVHLVKTDKKDYYIKQYSKDAIRNDRDLLKRKRQIAVAEKFKENGVPAVLPLSFDNRYFIKYNKDYFLLFDYMGEQPITDKELNSKKIKKLATTLAIIHKLDIQSNLSCQYKKIKIDFNKYLKKYSRINNELYELLKENHIKLNELITNCNNNISKVKEHLCVSHNDYKLLNILWKKDFMYLIDFDAAAMSNPTVSFAEASFALSRQNKQLNEAFYKDFLTSYIKRYGPLETPFKDALNVAMNGKLQWLEYIMSKCSKRNEQSIKDTMSMIKELKLFIESKEKLLDIYNSIKTKRTNK